MGILYRRVAYKTLLDIHFPIFEALNFSAKDLSIVTKIYINSPIQYVTCDCLFQWQLAFGTIRYHFVT